LALDLRPAITADQNGAKTPVALQGGHAPRDPDRAPSGEPLSFSPTPRFAHNEHIGLRRPLVRRVVCTDNLNAGVAVMKSAQDGA
jgi:hypothetical protein